METFVKIAAATAILGVLVSWITYGILTWMRESAPWLLQESGWRPDLPAPTVKKTRLVPKGKAVSPSKQLPFVKPLVKFAK